MGKIYEFGVISTHKKYFREFQTKKEFEAGWNRTYNGHTAAQ